MNNMFKVVFQTCLIGGTIYYICRILGKCNKVLKIKTYMYNLSTVILEDYLSIHILQNRCFYICCQQGRYCLSVINSIKLYMQTTTDKAKYETFNPFLNTT